MRKLPLLLLIWAIPACISFLQGWLIYRGMNIPVTPLENALIAFGAWWIWVPATPFIVWLGRRYDARSWRKAAFIHLPLSMLFGVLFLGWSAVLSFSVADQWPMSFAATLANEVLFLHLVALIYWAVLGVSYALDYHARYETEKERALMLDLERSKLEAALAGAKLSALQMQLQPHFLFNSLHAVSALMSTDVAGARRMLVRLADLLRTVLDSGDTRSVPLRQEFEWLEQYLDIEAVRFGDRLTCDVRLAADAGDLDVPPFILQPVVENAIRHGIEKRAAARQLSVTGNVEEGRLVLQVMDDGPGYLPSAVTSGVGLANTKERLQTLYGASATLEIGTPEGGKGCAVTITLPAPVSDHEAKA
ncbi:MAG: histidine kinase [Alphaproteobacteria bacterium]|nr:histidine kinase [Alphaproteobacteria bacterium]